MIPTRYVSSAAIAFVLGLWWLIPAASSAQIPVGGDVLSAHFQATPADMERGIDFSPAAPWMPLLAVDWSAERARTEAWVRADWNRRGLHLSLVLPNARDSIRSVVGMGLPAPFELFIAMEGGAGEYRLRCVPLVDPVSAMTKRLHAYLFNHRLGANARLGEAGHVLCHEVSLLGVLADSMETRWRPAPEGGLQFEALIPWQTLRLPTPPPGTEIQFSLHVNQPRTEPVGIADGTLRLLGAGVSDAILPEGSQPLLPGPAIRQPEPLIAAYPHRTAATPPVTFSLVEPGGRVVSTSEGSISGDAAFGHLSTDGLPDGEYTVQVLQERRPVAEHSVRLVGRTAETEIDARRRELGERLDRLNENALEARLVGHVARARRMLELAALPPHPDSGEMARSERLVADAAGVVEAVENGRRPDRSLEGFEHPAGFALDGRQGPMTFIPVRGRRARLVVDTDSRADWSLTPRLYGTFSEPVHYDRPIYSWLYAQQLRNPSFEFGHPTAEQTVSSFVNYGELEPNGAEAALAGQWLPRVPAGVEAVAAPWIAVGRGAVELTVDCEAYNDRQCQRVVAGPGSRDAGVAQIIELPAWRSTRYHLRGFARSDGSVDQVRAVLYHEGRPVDAATLDGIGEEWSEVGAELVTPLLEGPENAFLLALIFDGPGSLDLDLVTLYPDDAIDGFDPQALMQLRELNTGWVRWPGGNYASDYHWRDGVGPVDLRPSTPNPSWPGLNPNSVGTDEFLRLAERAGFEVMITVNAGSGTAEEAARWVEYVNADTSTVLGRMRARNGRAEPYGVRYWNIGNELWGHWQVGYTNPEEYARRYSAFAQAMREVDPSIQIIANAHGGHSESPPDPWNRPLLEHYGDELEVMDIHTYVSVPSDQGHSPAEQAFLLSAVPLSYERWMAEFREDLLRRDLEHVQVIVGEYNARIRSDSAAMNRIGDLLAYGGYLHGFMRQGEYMVGANATEYSPFNPRALPFDRMHPRYDLFRTYAEHAGTVPLEARLETPVRQQPFRVGRDVLPLFNLPLVDAVALSEPNDGSLGISLINRNVEAPIELQVDLGHFRPDPTARWFLFQGGSSGGLSEETVEIARQFTVTLPPHSVSLLKVYPANGPGSGGRAAAGLTVDRRVQ